MPILFVHGVRNRDEASFEEVRGRLRETFAPRISRDAANVYIEQVFWGRLGVAFGWNGSSRPRTRIFRQAGDDAAATPEQTLINWQLRRAIASAGQSPAQRPADPYSAGQERREPVNLDGLQAMAPSEFFDLAGDLAIEAAPRADRARLARIIDTIATDVAFTLELDRAQSLQSQLDLFWARLAEEVASDQAVREMGLGDTWRDAKRAVAGGLQAVKGAAANSVMAVVEVARPGMNELLSMFIGDVCNYLATRGTATRGSAENRGKIPSLFLEKLLAAHANKVERDEPLIVLTHSMGGQIVYDALTYFMPRDERFDNVKIDFWCATASQVGFFAEANLFLEPTTAFGPGRPIPFPKKYLGAWWNVWDYNDIISFSAHGIIDDIDDERFDTGDSLLAHTGYLKRHSFYRRFLHKLEAVGLTVEEAP